MRELTEELLDQIKARIVKAIEPDMIYLFGSYAMGQADEDSDLDLLVVVADTEESPREIALRGRAGLRGLMFPVDIIVCTQSELTKWADVKCTLIYTVTRKGRLIYESQDGTGKRMAHAG